MQKKIERKFLLENSDLNSPGEFGRKSNLENKYEISCDACENLLALRKKPLIEKTRYKIEFSGLIWEANDFHHLKVTG